MQAKRELSQSLSFNNYSNRNQLAEIADRVVEEFRFENGTDDDFFVDDNGGFREVKDENEDDDEFEFSFVKESEISPVAADEIFYNGQIRPIYPIFNRDLLSNNNDDNIIFGSSNSNTNSNSASGKPKTIRLPLRKLFLEEEREANSSCSSSEADDLESIPAGTYCVWRPKETENSCKKSNSTGSSSKRWKFRNLLYRSNSDGKDTFVFLTPSFKKKENKLEKPTMKTDNAPPKGTPKSMNYVKNGGEKRKTYLPYRQDLVGFFANMNGMSKNNVLPL
ncbi:uncharacterized protein LOC132055820 [Lycium ferocissimum]|uniref:uncharacterized protein LOC132055820 n=1 Tax=Lycium ferocissimum TaxID=112874 RepID=UPI0028163D56|nr:uncharacterized protein LOC132055820 [Lycium ferocissimum]